MTSTFDNLGALGFSHSSAKSMRSGEPGDDAYDTLIETTLKYAVSQIDDPVHNCPGLFLLHPGFNRHCLIIQPDFLVLQHVDYLFTCSKAGGVSLLCRNGLTLEYCLQVNYLGTPQHTSDGT